MLEEIFSSQSDQDHILKKKKKKTHIFPWSTAHLCNGPIFLKTFTTLISVIRAVILGELFETDLTEAKTLRKKMIKSNMYLQ